MPVLRYVISAVAGLVLAGLSPPGLAGALERDAQAFIHSLAEEAVRTLTARDTPRPQRIERFRTMFDRHFAVPQIGKWILGRHWKKATEGERAEFLVLFEDLMVVSYVDRFAKYTNESLDISRTLAQGPDTAIVFSEIVQPETASRIRIDWRVGKKGGVFKIFDVVVEGTSMSTTLRSDFGSIIRQKGGKVAGLLEVLRAKTAQLKTTARN
jgi:phospholipid transport system substrate-binding protein